MTKPISLPAPRHTPYGLLRAAPFRGDIALPRESEIVIIGGGLCGVMTAYFLAKRNIPVLLCEKAEIACEASSRAFGWVSELLLDPIKMPMSLEAKRLWHDIQADAGETGFRPHGLAFFAENEDETGFFEGWLQELAGIASPDNMMLSASQIKARYPGLRKDYAAAIFSPTDGSSEPIIAAAAIAGAARRAGARIVTGCAVRGLDLKGGRIEGVFTEQGRVKTSTVLCAANAWSRLFCGNHGIDIPQINVIMPMGRSTVTDGPVGAGAANGGGWREMIDGTFSLGGRFGVRVPVTRDAISLRRQFRPLMQSEMGTAKPDFGRAAWIDLGLKRRWKPDGASPFEKHRVLAGTPTRGFAETSLKLSKAIFAGMADAGVMEEWSGVVPLTPDNMPIAGPTGKIPGFHVLTGLSYGISWGPSLGKMMADLMTGAIPSIDPLPYRLNRFTDGSPIVVRH